MTYKQFINYLKDYISDYEDYGDETCESTIEDFCRDIAKYIEAKEEE